MADEIIAESKRVQDEVAALTEHTFDNTVRALADNDALSSTKSASCYFPSYVSPDKATRYAKTFQLGAGPLQLYRDASTEANKKLEEFEIESNMREDVYQALLKYKAKGEKLEPDSQRGTSLHSMVINLTWLKLVLDKMIEVFDRNGLGLPAEKRELLKEKKKREFIPLANFSGDSLARS